MDSFFSPSCAPISRQQQRLAANPSPLLLLLHAAAAAFLVLLLLLPLHASSLPAPSHSPVGSSWNLLLPTASSSSSPSPLTVLLSPHRSFSLILSWNLTLCACSISLLHYYSNPPFWSSSSSLSSPQLCLPRRPSTCRLSFHPNGSLSLSHDHLPIWRSPPLNPPLPRSIHLTDTGVLLALIDDHPPSLLPPSPRSLRLTSWRSPHEPRRRSLLVPTMHLDGEAEDIDAAAASPSHRRSKKILAMEIIFPVFGFLLLLSIIFLAYMLRSRLRSQTKGSLQRRRHGLDDEDLFVNLGSRLPPRFSYADIVAATRGFQKKLGEGAYGVVFEGDLQSSATPIAVKVFTDTATMACRKGFCAEVMSIGQKSHPNLVSLLGYCAEDEHRMLVYELMANGSLNQVLFRGRRKEKGDGDDEREEEGREMDGESEGNVVVLDWGRRRRIAEDTAKALAFLHAGDESSRVVHCDVKPENILLNEKWEAKVSDFGLAKLLASSSGHQEHDGDGEDDGNLAPSNLLDNQQQHHVLVDKSLKDQTNNNNNKSNIHGVHHMVPLVSAIKGIRGTFGYLAPEWIHPDCTLDTISPASDVYSFGIVLLELIAGRRSILPSLPFLPGLAFDLLAHGQDLAQLLDPRLSCSHLPLDPSDVHSLTSIALWCIQEDLSLRPSMAKVLDMLAGLVPIPTPPICDYFIGSSHFFDENGRPSIPRGSTTSFSTFSTTNPSNTSSNTTLSWQPSILSGR